MSRSSPGSDRRDVQVGHRIRHLELDVALELAAVPAAKRIVDADDPVTRVDPDCHFVEVIGTGLDAVDLDIYVGIERPQLVQGQRLLAEDVTALVLVARRRLGFGSLVVLNGREGAEVDQ